MNPGSSSHSVTPAAVIVSVNMPSGMPAAQPAQVILKGASGFVQLYASGHENRYRGTVAPGNWELKVSIPNMGLVTPARSVAIPPKGKTMSLYLGDPTWPSYRYGENLVLFEPHEDIIAVCCPNLRPAAADVATLVARLIAEVPGLCPIFPIPVAKAIWLFRYRTPPPAAHTLDVIRDVMSVYGARAGMPVDLTPGQLKVLDRRFIVHFSPAGEQQGLLTIASTGGAVVRKSSVAPHTWILDFTQGIYSDHLRTIEGWISSGLAQWAEPDLLAEFSEDAFPPAAMDPKFKSQTNLIAQNAPQAWRLLNGLNPDLTLGSPSVVVATVDEGIDPSHPDVGGGLTDGTPQITEGFDFLDVQPFSAPGYKPYNSHGMGVYGIIAALTNNSAGVGIAPNTHQIVVRKPGLLTADYPEVLLWVAGLSSNTPPGWPAPPKIGAAIINCSHGVDGLALSSVMDLTLNRLAAEGRGGLGTLTVYSAGNRGFLIGGFRVWAAHPMTLGISNVIKDHSGEHLWRGFGASNYGPEIDLCALGEGTVSLDLNAGTKVFGGTSAAAPVVAAAAALILSKNPALTWQQLRDLLCQTAVQIDTGNTDPEGKWVMNFSQWYGNGRLDIEAAVAAA
jgi:hypothetical protein